VDEVTTLLDLLRDIRDELRYLRQDVREAPHSNQPAGGARRRRASDRRASGHPVAGHPANGENVDPIGGAAGEPAGERQEARPQVSRSAGWPRSVCRSITGKPSEPSSW